MTNAADSVREGDYFFVLTFESESHDEQWLSTYNVFFFSRELIS